MTGPSLPPATGTTPPLRTAAAFAVAFTTLVGSSTLILSLSVLAPLLMSAAGTPPEAFGWISGAAGLGSVWLYMANTAFTVALGPIRALGVAMVIALAGVGLLSTASYPLMLLGAVFIGFAYATTTPAGSQILADNTPVRLRGRIFSLRQSGVPLGGAIAGVAGSAIGAAYDWRIALLVVALFLVATSIPLALAPSAFNESRPRPRFRIAKVFSLLNLRQPFQTLAGTPGLPLIALASIGFATVQGITNAFFVTFLAVGLGYDVKLAGLLFALNQGASAAGRIGLGFLADWIGSPRPILCALSLASAASAIAIASMGPDWPLYLLILVAIGTGLSIATWNGLYMAEIAALAPETASQATAGATFFVFGTYVVMPPLAGLVIATLGYRAAFLMVALCVLGAGAALLVGWRGRMWAA